MITMSWFISCFIFLMRHIIDSLLFPFIISIVDSFFMVKLLEFKNWIFKSWTFLEVILTNLWPSFLTIFFKKDWQKIDQKNWQNSTKHNFFFWLFYSLNHELSILQRCIVACWNQIFLINNFANAYEAHWPIL